MEILNIERWDSMVEFRRDLRDAHYYQQVVSFSFDWPVISSV